MAEFDSLVRPPDARDFSSTATMFGNLLSNLPQVFRQGAAQADLQQAAQSGQLLNPDGSFNYPLMMNILARSGDVSGIQGLLGPMQTAQGDVLARNLLGGGGGGGGGGVAP